MAARAGVAPEKYEKLMAGTRFLSLKEAIATGEKKDGFSSLYGSTRISNEFQVSNKVYEKSQDVDSYIDPSLINAVPAMSSASP
jgi:NitT/TauT family transport system substrate-binding protein